MKKLLLLFSAAVLSVSLAVAASPQMIVVGHGNPNVSIIDVNANEIVWQYALEQNEHCNSIHMLPCGDKMIFTTQLGVKIVSLDKELVWQYKLEGEGEVHSVQPAKDGGFAIFIAGSPARILEFSKEYKQVNELTFDPKTNRTHGQFRQAIKAKNGNWMVPLFPTGEVLELDANAKTVQEHTVGGTAFGLKESLNGTLLLGLGDGHYVAEYDPATKTMVREIKELDGVQLLYMAQFQQLSKKSFMIANWSGHNKAPLTAPAPQLIQFDDNNVITWSWDDEGKNLGKISAFYYSKKPLIK